MSDTQALAVEIREEFGSAASRRLRRSGQVPCVVYSGGNEPAAISIEREILEKAISSPSIIQLDVKGTVKNVLSQEIQWEYMTNTLLHVDFKEIRMDEKIQTSVPLVTVGDAAGLAQGGTLDQMIFEIEVECLPSDIPESVEIDVTELGIGENISIGQLVMPDKVVAVFSDENQTLVSVAMPRKEEEEETEDGVLAGEVPEGDAAEGGAAEGDAPAEGSDAE